MKTRELTLNSFLQELCPFIDLKFQEFLVKFLFFEMIVEYSHRKVHV